jgi:hypothetical protein
VVGAIVAAALTHFFGLAASGKPASVPPHSVSSPGTTPIQRVPTLSITSPIGIVSCQPNRPQCSFAVDCHSAGVTSNMDIFVLVFPIGPGGSAGHGWYIQQFPASVAANGQWTESPAYLVSHNQPVHTGDTLQIEAVIVRTGASYHGTPLGTRARQVRPIPRS